MSFRRFLGGFRSRFLQDRRGNVVPIFAIAMVPIIGFVGAAVDYSRASSARTSLQNALDATALFLSREAQGLTQEQVEKKGQDYFNNLFTHNEAKNVRVTTTFTDVEGTLTVKVAATAEVDTILSRVLARENVTIGSSTEVVWGMKRLELALVLDNTTSMASQSRMVELKKATKSLLDTLQKAARKADDVKVAIVPYGTDVNVGTGNVNASWLDWGDGQDVEASSNRPWPYWTYRAGQGRWKDPPAIVATWLNTAANRRTWDLTRPGQNSDYAVRDCPFTTSAHGFRCSLGPASDTNSSTITTIPASYESQQNRKNHAGLICPSMDNGSKATKTTGVLHDRYYNGCWNSVPRPETTQFPVAQWYKIRVGSDASCGSGTSSSRCTCFGSGSNRFCALDPEYSWGSNAKGSTTTCPAGVTTSGTSADCKPLSSSNNERRLRPYDHFWRPAENTQVASADRSDAINQRATPQPSAWWTGCVRDRIADYDTTDTTPGGTAATQFQPVQARNCAGSASLEPITPLTNNWTALSETTEAMNTGGGTSGTRYTNITIGLAWGWHALFNNDPLTQASEPKPDLDKVIILMTDGDNTRSGWSTSAGTIDDRTEIACTNAKAAGIKIYTVRVMDGNESLLKDCASNVSMYYNVETATQLNVVFSAIAQNLASLRISK